MEMPNLLVYIVWMTPEQLNQTAKDIVDVAYCIHRAWGPGMRESVYEALFAEQMRARSYKIERQKRVSAKLGGVQFKNAFRPDIVVNDCVVVEVKAQQNNHPANAKQVITYLKAMDLRLGFVINFGMPTVKEGIRRLVNNF